MPPTKGGILAFALLDAEVQRLASTSVEVVDCTSMSKRTRAAIYTRISKDEEGHSLSPEQQAQQCREYAEREGWEVVEVFTERHASAFRQNAKRPEYDRMIANINEGAYDVVVVRDIDRFSRQGWMAAAAVLQLFADRRCALVAINQSIDTRNADGEMLLGIHLSMARSESERISRRTRAANRYRAEQGHTKVTHVRQFGYLDPQRSALHPEEAPVVVELAERLLAGESYGKLARELNDRGIRTTAGRLWSDGTLARFMRNPALAGIRTYRNERQSRGTWEPILTEDQHRAICALAPKVNRTFRKVHPYSQVIRCCCGASMVVGSKNGAPYMYKCACLDNARDTNREKALAHHPRSTNNGINYERLTAYLDARLDELKYAAVRAIADRNPRTSDGLVAQRDEASAKLTTLAGHLEDLETDYYANGTISREDFNRRQEKLIALRTEAQAAYDAAVEQLEWYSTGNIDGIGYARIPTDKMDLVPFLIERVIVGPATKHMQDPAERVTVIPKTF